MKTTYGRSYSMHRFVRNLSFMLASMMLICAMILFSSSYRRWEVYHGQLSESGSKWDTNVNPRKPGSHTLENFRFLMTDEVLQSFEGPANVDDPTFVNNMVLLAHTLSPNRSGIYDELMALIRTKVVVLQTNGIPCLAKDWWSSVDVLLLDDMWNHWGVHVDEKSNHGVHAKIRKVLQRKWKRDDNGWALSPYFNDIVFDLDEFDEWRVAFEAKQQTTSEGIHGIGRFG